MPPVEALGPDALYRACDPATLPFDSTADLEPLDGVVGQERAFDALEYAMGVELDGHNVFVAGPRGTGRRTFARARLEAHVAGRATPADWCYVNNFAEPRKPVAIALPAGRARAFADDMLAFIDEVQSALSASFESEAYRTNRQEIESAFQEAQGEALEDAHQEARRRGIRIMQSPTGFVFAPIRNGEVLEPDAFEKLPESEQDAIREAVAAVGEKLQKAMEGTPARVREMMQRVRQLDNETMGFAVDTLIRDLRAGYDDVPGVLDYLDAVEKDLLKHPELLREGREPPAAAVPVMLARTGPVDSERSPAHRRYGVNPVVCRDADAGAPVEIEEHPSYVRLLGSIEYRAELGALSTDFHLVRGGALHRANGGCLVLEAHRVLAEPFAWSALKEALKTGHLRIEPLSEQYGLATTLSLEPEPIPLAVKVVLVGEPRVLSLLQEFDPEFGDLFKVIAEFDDRMPRHEGNELAFARNVATVVRECALLPAGRGAVARLIEESSRHAGDRERLSTRIARTADIVREAHYWASKSQQPAIRADDVEAALASHERRHGRVRDRVQEEIERGTVLIDVDGEHVGQVNGLAVMQTGGFAFGKPSRITARVSLGSGKVVDIEREAELGGPLHSKGMLILAGFIASNYVIDEPLSLSATIAFEQSYGGIDGDSASSAELYALLSAIADIPLRQCYAVTGSVNQHGEVQAIGGVNEKIEGFFDLCAARGLTGRQGVLIPASNVKHLVLRRRVRDAVAAGRFAVYAVERIDEGLEILTGREAGVADSEGVYPAGSLNSVIRERLSAFAESRRLFGRAADGRSVA